MHPIRRPIARNARSAAEEDAGLVRRALAGDQGAFRAIMQKYNRRLFRMARSILRDDGEAEDALQEAYIRAFTHLGQFRGDSGLATWLTRIVINEALGRRRKAQPVAVPAGEADKPMADIISFPGRSEPFDPERISAQREILRLVEAAIDGLPAPFRTVFVARIVEGLSVEETARMMSIPPQTVKTRLHRAREMLRMQIDRQIGPVLMTAFPFAGKRCARVTDLVMQRLFPGE